MKSRKRGYAIAERVSDIRHGVVDGDRAVFVQVLMYEGEMPDFSGMDTTAWENKDKLLTAIEQQEGVGEVIIYAEKDFLTLFNDGKYLRQGELFKTYIRTEYSGELVDTLREFGTHVLKNVRVDDIGGIMCKQFPINWLRNKKR